MSLQSELLSRLSSGLARQSIQSCSKWALAYRMMGKPYPGPWTFKYHPWTREVHDSQAELNVIQKASQMGFTETALNRVFYMMDIQRVDCLYLLPNAKPDANDFSKGRFDPAIENSTHLQQIFSNVKNVGHKQAGSTNLYVRGTNGKSGLKSIPVAYITFDEVDEMDQENIVLAFERTAGQPKQNYDMISTPTVNDHGINAYYKNSTMESFVFPCPSCSRITELVFPDCLVITGTSVVDPKIKESYIICRECKNKLPHETKTEWLAKGFWRATNPNGDGRGFCVNHLYSTTVTPEKMAKQWIKAQSSQADEQEFYNSGLGLPHIVAGARISQEHLNKAKQGHKLSEVAPKRKGTIRTMGIDVGKWFHYEIVEWSFDSNITHDINLLAVARVVALGKVANVSEIDVLVKQHQVDAFVIDANPERRTAKELCDRFPGRGYMCIYANSNRGKDIKRDSDYRNPLILVDRTYWLDQSQGRFYRGDIKLPCDTPEEYETQVSALIKHYKKDKDGNAQATYVTVGTHDHYAHARNYSEIALPLAASFTRNRNISEFL